jgi:hypothetical protein
VLQIMSETRTDEDGDGNNERALYNQPGLPERALKNR